MNDKINCLIVDDEPIAREIIESFIKKTPQLLLKKSCNNAIEAFQVLSKQKIDLIFLDINMPEITGLDFVKSINTTAKIIFTTAYREFAIDGFDLQAVDYLLKPIPFDRFLKSINKYLSSHNYSSKEPSAVNSSFFVRANRKMQKINFEDILYIESLSDYIKIYTTKKTIVTRNTISSIETKLPKNQFLRIHRSFIIAIPKISAYTHEFIEIDSKAISISRSYKDAVLLKLEGI